MGRLGFGVPYPAMTRIRRGAATAALPALALVVATALAGCTDDSGDSDGTEQSVVTVTSTASSPVQPEPTPGEDEVPVPDLPEPAQAPGEIVGSVDSPSLPGCV